MTDNELLEIDRIVKIQSINQQYNLEKMLIYPLVVVRTLLFYIIC